jgi:peptide/nickel transport system permease protein
MTKYLARRLFYSLFVLLGVSLIVFVLIRLSGDPAALMLPLDATEEDLENYRAQLGLNRPWPVQYVDFVSRAVIGDFGTSIRHQQPAMGMVMDRMPATMQLAGLSFLIAVLIAVPLGILSAVRPNSAIDRVSVIGALGGQAVPTFWLGIMLILVFSVGLRWLPSSGRGGLEHLILPALTLGMYSAAVINRLLRSSLREVLQQDYIRTAQAKGYRESFIVLKHALKNAAIPVVTVMGLQISALMGGAVITETVFSYPGAGLLLVQSLRNRDIPVIQAFVMLIAFIVIIINLGVDVIYSYLDPRIRFS